MRRFLAASDYCFDYSDSDDEGTYDPTRECFHVELRMPSMVNEDKGVGSRSPPPKGQAAPHLHASSPGQRGTRTLPPRNFDG